ncbi:MAG: efflux RND transporter periplasmic adaptor subunit [Verrucomicrobia bacterium]|nr:efflux RND transporter periplasmic adaptor subunit [Verrucomicrobiota bacterium]
MPEKSGGSSMKWIVAAVLVAVVGAGGWLYLRHKRADPVTFKTATVGRGELMQLVTATGTLNPVVNVTVGSQVSGRISKLYVDYNSTVTSNQVIAEIDSSTYQATVAQATADLANAKANLELQQVEYGRSSDLFTNKLVSGSDFDTALATLHEAEAMVKIKQASLSNAMVNLNYCKILSPVDGVVISRSVDLGQTVASSFNTPTLFQIANDLTKMQIDSNVAEADVGGVVQGQAVDFTVDAYPNRTFHGEVRQVRNAPTTVNNVVTYDAVIEVTNADYKLKPGMTANVSIIVAQRADALNVPNAALRFRVPDNVTVLTNTMADAAPAPATNQAAPGQGGQGNKGKGRSGRAARVVYVVSGDESSPVLKRVQVKTGITDGIFTEITDGLSEGDKVVVGSTGGETSTAAAAGTSPFGGGGFGRGR